MIILKCQWCDREFVTRNKNQKYCSCRCYYFWRSKNINGKNHPQWKGGKIKTKCLICKKEFNVWQFQKNKNIGKYCSLECYNESKKGKSFFENKHHTKESRNKMSKAKKGIIPWIKGNHHSEKTKDKLRQANLGKKHTEETKMKISEANKGKKFTKKRKKRISDALRNKKYPERQEKNSIHWKGNNVGYGGLHYWVYKWLGKPDTCEHCGKIGLSGKQIHWANKSGNYLRDKNDWIRLCVSCHKKYDKLNQPKRFINILRRQKLPKF